MPEEKDGNGYIALLSTEGKVKQLEWVTGLDAPKGMGVQGNYIFATKIDEVVVIDTKRDEITEGLSRPNGLYIKNERTLLTSSGSQELKIPDKKTLLKTLDDRVNSADIGFYIKDLPAKSTSFFAANAADFNRFGTKLTPLP